jgi:hypothetical protein
MSFIVKNSQLSTETVQSLNSLLEQDINAGVAFKLLRIVKHMSSIIEDKTSAEKKIIDKWSQKDERGQYIKAKDENGNVIEDAILLTDLDGFSKDMSDLLNVENEIPYEKIMFDDLNLQKVKLKDLIKIEFLFEME